MRILLFSASYPPRVGGLETVTHQLARKLMHRGCRVIVVTNRYPRSLPSCETIDGVVVHRVLCPAIMPRRDGRSVSQRVKVLLLLPLVLVAVLRLGWLILRFRPDVVNVHYFSDPAVYAVVIARLLGVPVVLSYHGSDLNSVPYPRLYRWWALRICRMSKALTVPSRNLATFLAGVASPAQHNNVIIAYNGIEPETEAERCATQAKNYVLVLARLVNKKGVDVAIRSMVVLKAHGIETRLLVAGDGPQRSQLESMVEELGLASDVAFVGIVQPSATHELMKNARLVLVPSREESFGIVCLEAMRARKAVVASHVGGIPEIVVDGVTGFLVEPDDPGALASAVMALIRDPERAKEMGRRGHERLAHFTVDRMVDSYMRAYSSVVAHANASNRRLPSGVR